MIQVSGGGEGEVEKDGSMGRTQSPWEGNLKLNWRMMKSQEGRDERLC